MSHGTHRGQLACGLTCLGLALALSGCDSSRAAASGLEPEQARVDRGFEIAPVALNLEGKDRQLVGLGSYIVNAQGACNDCHTNPPFAPGGDPFLGERKEINAERYLAGGRSFGPVVSANLTPDENGRPGGLTREAFIEIIRTGREDGRLLQVMPWVVYQEMTERDLSAIYEYLTAIPRVPSTP